MFGVTLDQRSDKGRFANAWRTDHGNDCGWRIGGEAVDLGDMEAFFFDLLFASKGWHGIVKKMKFLHHVSGRLVWPDDLDSHSQRLWDSVLSI